MSTLKMPPLWLLVLIVGLPQLSETVYTPFRLIMGLVHNGTLFPMPLFFMAIGLSMYSAIRYITKSRYTL